jgi:hypothetical protein
MKTMMMIAAALAMGTTAMADDKMKKEEPKKDVKKEEPKKWEAPKPDQAIADMAKGMGGNWKCTGKAVMDASGAWVEFKGTNKMSVDLDKFWIKGEWSMDGNNKSKMKGVEYMTFDPGQKKWYRIAMDSTGGHEVAWSEGFKDGKSNWTGEMRMMGQVAKTKAVVAFDGKELKVNGEAEMGKKWMPVFEMSCKK